MAEKRVIEHTASSEIYNDDWFLKDSVLQGTTKISKDNLIDKIGASKINSIAEDYDSTSTYNKDDFAFYENKLYRCLANNTTGTWDGTKWEEFDLPTALITTAHNIETAEFTIGTYYSADDLVLKDGKLYQCVVFHNATEWKSQFWRSVTVDTMLDYLSSSLAPEHNPSTVYAVGDLVTHNKALWRCTQAGAGSFVDANWENVTVSALIAEISDNLTADGISYDNTTSGLEADNVQEAIDEVVTDIESVETALETKAEVDGFYDELYAGNLLSDNTETDNAPYLYRQSPSGKSCVDLSVVGGTVAWNQLVQFTQSQLPSNANGITYSYTDGTSFKISGTATAQEQRSGWFGLSESIGFKDNINHKVIICTKIISGTSSNTILWGYNNVLWDWGESNIFIVSDTAQRRFYYRIPDGTVCNDLILTMTAIDLTQMFGSTIADYIYSLEQAEAGSGIAWLKSYGFLTKDYYAYDSGSLQSVKTSARVVRNNMYNSATSIQGTITTGGAPSTSTTRITSDFIMVDAVPYSFATHNEVLIKCIVYYDENKTYINDITVDDTTKTFTPPKKGYVKIVMAYSNNGTIYPTAVPNAQMNSGSQVYPYQPYSGITYPLDSDLTLRGIVKKDANNNLYYDGDVYSADGSVKRKWGYARLSDLEWSTGNIGNTQVWLATITNPKIPSGSVAFEGFGYPYNIMRSNGIYNADSIAIISGDRIAVNNGSTTVKPSGEYIYELATPTTESATPFTNPQLVGSTEEFVDAGTSASTPTRDVDIPAGQDSKYHTDLKAKLEELAKIPDVPSSNGTYTLKATRSASGVEYNWVSD